MRPTYLTFKGCLLLSLTYVDLPHPLVPTTSTHKKNKTTTKHIPKNLHPHEPSQFPSLLHKSTTTPLNDKRKTNGGFWCLDIDRTFFIHTLNPNSGILYTIPSYTTFVWVSSMSLHPLFCLPISISNKYTTHAPQIAPQKCIPLFESKPLRKSSIK